MLGGAHHLEHSGELKDAFVTKYIYLLYLLCLAFRRFGLRLFEFSSLFPLFEFLSCLNIGLS